MTLATHSSTSHLANHLAPDAQLTNQSAATPSPLSPAVEMRNICKKFGAARANDSVSITIGAATIHGIVGENGAGKTTLMSILYGFTQADSGTIAINGQVVSIKNTAQAIAQGIGMVHQHFMLVSTLSAIDNILLGVDDGFWLKPSRDANRKKVQELQARYGLAVRLDELVGNMPIGEQQRLEILKTLYWGAKILILDEPTAVLTPQEVEGFFQMLHQLRQQGVTIIIITHKLHEIMQITDQVTVMRQGQVVINVATGHTNPEQLAEWMVGRPVAIPNIRDHVAEQAQSQSSAPEKQVALRVDQLGYVDARGVRVLKTVSFDLYRGEILGVAGVSGNGQSELLAMLAGVLPIHHGQVVWYHQTPGASSGVVTHTVDGKHPMTPALLRRWGGAWVPEDRIEEGMVKNFAMKENAVLGYHAQKDLGSVWHLHPKRIRQRTQDLIDMLDVRPPLPEIRSANMSGGNQQKMILARELSAKPQVLLIGQPTRGVDIGAIEQIYRIILQARSQGTAIILVSAEVEEILTLSDRIMVMNQGQVTGLLDNNEQVTPALLGRLMSQTSQA